VRNIFRGWQEKLLRGLAFLGVLIVFLCMQSVSISHTLAWTSSHQYHGWEAYVFVGGVELAFVVGLLLIILDRREGKSLNPGTVVFFGIPTIVVGAANWVSGNGYGVTGIALGLVPAVLVLAGEKVLTRAMGVTTSGGEEAKEEDALSVSGSPEETSAPGGGEEKVPEEIASPVSAPSPEEEKSGGEEEKSPETPTSGGEEELRKEEAPTSGGGEEETTASGGEEERQEEEITTSGGGEEETASGGGGEKEENPPASRRKERVSSPAPVISSREENSSESPVEVALRLYEENRRKMKGKVVDEEDLLPSRNEIMDIAGCKEWAARKAREFVKKKIAS
jgi:hypothetical protein